MFTERTSVGLDVHAQSVVVAAIDTQTGQTRTARLVPSHQVVLEWVHGLPGPVAVTYEAGPTGYGLARAFAEAGTRCVVAAPSKIIRPAGDRVKTDTKDAMLLARLLRMGEITAVRVPSVGGPVHTRSSATFAHNSRKVRLVSASRIEACSVRCAAWLTPNLDAGTQRRPSARQRVFLTRVGHGPGSPHGRAAGGIAQGREGAS